MSWKTMKSEGRCLKASELRESDDKRYVQLTVVKARTERQ
jgi:predicted component of type VI protein secretion system